MFFGTQVLNFIKKWSFFNTSFLTSANIVNIFSQGAIWFTEKNLFG